MSTTIYQKIIDASPKEIVGVASVRQFFRALVFEGCLNFHPDDSFAGMVEIKSGEQIFTADEAAQLDALMAKCFEVADVYAIGAEIFEAYQEQTVAVRDCGDCGDTGIAMNGAYCACLPGQRREKEWAARLADDAEPPTPDDLPGH